MATSQSSKGFAWQTRKQNPNFQWKILLVWNILKHIYVGTCSVVSLVFFCPDHYGRRPKSRVLISEKIWGSMKYFSMSNIYWTLRNIYALILLYLAKGSKSLKPSIQSVWLQSNVVFAVRDQNPAHIFRRLSPNILQWLSRGSRKIQWEGKRNKDKTRQQ